MSIMGITRRKFTLEFKTEAAHRVIDTGRSVIDVGAPLTCIIRAKTNSGSGPIRTPFRFIPNKLPAESERGQ
jgi:hypothetical protein